jgi:integrase
MSDSPLRQRMIEDMAARKLNPHTQRGHILSCKRFATWLKRSPDTATPDEVRRFQLHLIENGASICNRNRIMTGVRFLFRVTLRRHDLAAEVWHIKEPQKLPPVLSREEVKRVLIMATSPQPRAMLTLAYGCGPRAGEVVRLRAGDIDSEGTVLDDGEDVISPRLDRRQTAHRARLSLQIHDRSGKRESAAERRSVAGQCRTRGRERPPPLHSPRSFPRHFKRP